MGFGEAYDYGARDDGIRAGSARRMGSRRAALGRLLLLAGVVGRPPIILWAPRANRQWGHCLEA